MIRFLIASLAIAPAALALPETQFGAVQDLLGNSQAFFQNSSFAGKDGVKISFTKFGAATGPKGCLVIAPGHSEPAIKYIEVAYDLAQRGFSPIYAIDHRGQGASDRLLPDPQKSNVVDFQDYAEDLGAFVNGTVLADPACRGQRLGLLAHSMGGAIAALYLERVGTASPFQHVALTAPMMKILYPPPRTEESVIHETWFACFTPFGPRCDDFAPSQGPYAERPFANNPYTHSEVRYPLDHDIYARWPSLEVGGATVRWVRAAALGDQSLRASEKLAQISGSFLVLQASEDQIVDNAGEDEFCAGTRNCRLEKMAGANHEILMETDSIRDRAMDLLVDFLGGN